MRLVPGRPNPSHCALVPRVNISASLALYRSGWSRGTALVAGGTWRWWWRGDGGGGWHGDGGCRCDRGEEMEEEEQHRDHGGWTPGQRGANPPRRCDASSPECVDSRRVCLVPAPGRRQGSETGRAQLGRPPDQFSKVITGSSHPFPRGLHGPRAAQFALCSPPRQRTNASIVWSRLLVASETHTSRPATKKPAADSSLLGGTDCPLAPFSLIALCSGCDR